MVNIYVSKCCKIWFVNYVKLEKVNKNLSLFQNHYFLLFKRNFLFINLMDWPKGQNFEDKQKAG